MSRQANPRIVLDGTFNTRDFGGYPTAGRRRMKPGIFYRSDSLHQLTRPDQERLRALNIRTIVDLRNQEEREKEPDRLWDGVKYICLSPDAKVAALGTGNIVNDRKKIEVLLAMAMTADGRRELAAREDEMAEQMRDLVRDVYSIEQYKAYLALLEDARNTPILHHCKGGKDRAGFAAVLVQLIMDVPAELIMTDYLATRDHMAERNKRRMAEYQEYTDDPYVLAYLHGLMQTKALYLEAVFDEMQKMSGSISAYIEQVMGITREKKLWLQELYTVAEE